MTSTDETQRIMTVRKALNDVIGERNQDMTVGMSTRAVFIASLLHFTDVATFVLHTESGGLENLTEEVIEEQVKLFRTTLEEAIRQHRLVHVPEKS